MQQSPQLAFVNGFAIARDWREYRTYAYVGETYGVNESTVCRAVRRISERYRNRRKRFGLRFNLIAAIHNLEICK